MRAEYWIVLDTTDMLGEAGRVDYYAGVNFQGPYFTDRPEDARRLPTRSVAAKLATALRRVGRSGLKVRRATPRETFRPN